MQGSTLDGHYIPERLDLLRLATMRDGLQDAWHISDEAWSAIAEQVAALATLSPAELGLAADSDDEDPVVQGLLAFIRVMVAVLYEGDTIAELAAELHDRLGNPRMNPALWAKALEHGLEDPLPVPAIRRCARLIRAGTPVDKAGPAAGVSVERGRFISRWLGQVAYLEDRRTWLAQECADTGVTVRSYRELWNGLFPEHTMSLGTAQKHMAAARERNARLEEDL